MSETMKTTIDWRYLPELPPEPDGYADRYLVSFQEVSERRLVEFVEIGWYEGKERWTNMEDDDLVGIYAWAAWPEAPPVKAQ